MPCPDEEGLRESLLRVEVPPCIAYLSEEHVESSEGHSLGTPCGRQGFEQLRAGSIILHWVDAKAEHRKCFLQLRLGF